MRHLKSGRKLNRTASHRKAMFRNMAVSLFEHEQISTTLPKAKELRRFAEPLITLGKKPSVANRRLAFARLRDRQAVSKLFDDLGVRFQTRPGGYLRIFKMGPRAGDAAPMAIVQLVEMKKKEPEVVEPKKAKAALKAPADKKPEKKVEKKEKPAKEKVAEKKAAPKKKAEKKTAKKVTAKKATKKKAAKKKTTKKS